MKYLLMLILTAAILTGLESCSGTEDPTGPNILFILTDDQAPWAIGASGNHDAITPNMDRLAREGAYLVNAYATTPVCSPSRASLLASRYGHELGITDWINPSGKGSLKGEESTLGLDTALITWPKLFSNAGYVTGLVGKWHLGDMDEFHPTHHGYRFFRGFLGGGTKTEAPPLEIDGIDRQFTGLTADILADQAIAFITENKDKPFCLSLHHRAPHTAWLPVAEEDMAPYREDAPSIPNRGYPDLDLKRLNRMMPEYLASVRSVDRNLGRVLHALDSLGLSENTVVIFTSDHGYSMGHNGIWHKGNGHWILTHPTEAKPNIPSNQRPNMYDNSIRVPALVRWPGKIKAGSRVEETVSNLDWYPTLLGLAGIQMPSGLKISGRDFSPILLGEKIEWDNDFYAEYSTHHQSMTHMRMYRTGEWKLIRDFLNPWRDELYDLKNDPAETTNLINDPSPEIKAIIGELHEKILRKMKELNDPVLELIME